MNIRGIHTHLFTLLCIITLVSVFTACEDETANVDTSSFGYEYLPVIVGKFRVYQSDSIILRSGGTVRDTVSSQLKEVVDSYTVNTSGDTIYNVKVYHKRPADTAFVYQKTVFMTKDAQKVTRQEDNLVFTKMVFPLKSGTRFNHNQYFDPTIDIEIGGEIFLGMYNDWNTRVESFNGPLFWQGQQTENVKIRLVDDASTSLEKKLYYETYIKNVGLYSKKMIFLQDNKGGSTPIEQRAIKGFYHDLFLIQHN